MNWPPGNHVVDDGRHRLKFSHFINENEMAESKYHHFAVPVDLMDPENEWQWLRTLGTSENQILCASW